MGQFSQNGMCVSFQGFLATCLGSSAEQKNLAFEFHDHSTIFRWTEGPRILGSKNVDEYR